MGGYELSYYGHYNKKKRRAMGYVIYPADDDHETSLASPWDA